VYPDSSDDQLLETVRQDPPDEAALDVLVQRHWAALFGRCRMLTQDPESARDLAQEAWYRVLRARRSLRSDGNFRGYLITIATNLWRDETRSARRAGPLAPHRMASLDASLAEGESEPYALAGGVPDLQTLEAEAHVQRQIDIDRALARLEPRLRDVLLARYLDGESAAEIGRRYGRTEQTISGWLRQAIRQVREPLDAYGSGLTSGTAIPPATPGFQISADPRIQGE